MKKNYGLLINGKWVKGSSSLNVLNPLNDKIISKISTANIEESIEAVNNCHYAFKSWSKFSAKNRSDILKNFYNLVKKIEKNFQKLLLSSPVNQFKNQMLK